MEEFPRLTAQAKRGDRLPVCRRPVEISQQAAALWGRHGSAALCTASTGVSLCGLLYGTYRRWRNKVAHDVCFGHGERCKEGQLTRRG